jgi:hypothetical protein
MSTMYEQFDGVVAQPRPPLIFVRNNAAGPTVFSKADVAWKGMWAPAGDSSGRDLLRVPSYLLDDPDFLDSVDRHVLEIEDADDPAVADRRQQRELTGEECVGPGQRGRDAQCGQSVIRPAGERRDRPPLCAVHEGLWQEFALVETGSAGDPANPKREVWVRRDLR